MGLWRDKTRGDWCYDFQMGGKRYAGRGHKTKAAARSARESRRQEIAQGSPPPTAGTDFKTAAYAYLDYAKQRFAAKTYDFKQRVLKRLHKYLGEGFQVEKVSTSICHEYLGMVTRTNNAYNAYRKDLLAFFSWCKIHLDLPANPVKKLDRLPHTPSVKRIPSENEILRMIAACTADQRPLFMAILHTLGRVDELLRLTWQDVNFEKKIVTLSTRKRKGGNYESDPLPMNNDLYAVLKSLWKSRRQQQWVFINPKTRTRYTRRPKMMSGICRRAGIEPIGVGSRIVRGKRRKVNLYYGFHALRHFMASYLNDSEKAGTKTIQRLLRHKSQRTTEIYLHAIEGAQRSALEGIEGKFTVAGDGCGSGVKSPRPAATGAQTP